MARFYLALILFSISCTPKHERGESLSSLPDSLAINQNNIEPFDLQVRKYEDPKRQTWQDPKFVIEALGDLTNLTVADIGAGTGYFTFQMAVPAKKVIAVDIEQRFLNYIEDRKNEMYDRQLASKIETRITSPNTPSFQEQEVDVVLMVNTIGYIENRGQYLNRVFRGIKKNGRLVIVDYKMGEMPVGPEDRYKVNVNDITRALKNAGFIIDSINNTSLQYQYLIKAHRPQ